MLYKHRKHASNTNIEIEQAVRISFAVFSVFEMDEVNNEIFSKNKDSFQPEKN
jgi:hypothetical protein